MASVLVDGPDDAGLWPGVKGLQSLRLAISPFATIGAFFLLFCASQEKFELKFPGNSMFWEKFDHRKIPNFSCLLGFLDSRSNSFPTEDH